MELDMQLHYGFMAGCSLSSYNPHAVYEIATFLSTRFDSFSVIQRCCGKPTNAMGQKQHFEKRFSSFEKDLEQLGIDVLIVACQNCYKTIGRHGTVRVISLWEVLQHIGIPDYAVGIGKGLSRVFTIHDSCPTRDIDAIHLGVRDVVNQLGYTWVESDASGRNTRCCGAGGMAMTANSEMAKRMRQKRLDSLEADAIIVYCASCKGTLSSGGGQVWHLLDLMFPTDDTEKAPDNVLANPLSAWKNRYISKQKLKKV